MIPIQKTHPDIDLPTQTPSGISIPAMDYRLTSYFQQFRCAFPVDPVTQLHRPEMRNMPVLIALVIHIPHPFLQLPYLPIWTGSMRSAFANKSLLNAVSSVKNLSNLIHMA
jgi:hypothetical protein